VYAPSSYYTTQRMLLRDAVLCIDQQSHVVVVNVTPTSINTIKATTHILLDIAFKAVGSVYENYLWIENMKGRIVGEFWKAVSNFRSFADVTLINANLTQRLENNVYFLYVGQCHTSAPESYFTKSAYTTPDVTPAINVHETNDLSQRDSHPVQLQLDYAKQTRKMSLT